MVYEQLGTITVQVAQRYQLPLIGSDSAQRATRDELIQRAHVARATQVAGGLLVIDLQTREQRAQCVSALYPLFAKVLCRRTAIGLLWDGQGYILQHSVQDYRISRSGRSDAERGHHTEQRHRCNSGQPARRDTAPRSCTLREGGTLLG